MLYEVSQTFFFRENGLKLEPGQTIELTEGQAELHNQNHPGLLKPVRQTAQAHAPVVRNKRTRSRK